MKAQRERGMKYAVTYSDYRGEDADTLVRQFFTRREAVRFHRTKGDDALNLYEWTAGKWELAAW